MQPKLDWIWFNSVPYFQRRHGSNCAKLIWMAWLGFGQTHLEASKCAGIISPGFWQGATSPPPVSYFQTQLHFSTDVPDHTVQNQPKSNLVLVTVCFWPSRPGMETSWCARIIQPASGIWAFWVRSGMFSGRPQARSYNDNHAKDLIQ